MISRRILARLSVGSSQGIRIIGIRDACSTVDIFTFIHSLPLSSDFTRFHPLLSPTFFTYFFQPLVSSTTLFRDNLVASLLRAPISGADWEWVLKMVLDLCKFSLLTRIVSKGRGGGLWDDDDILKTNVSLLM